jgi:hypothetical protein
MHRPYFSLTVANIKEISNFDIAWLIHIMFGDLCVATILGALLHLFVEAPSLALLKFI